MLKKILLGVGLIVVALVVAEVVALLFMKSSVTRYSQYWKERNTQTAPDNAFIYVALGDSTAQGIGATSPARGYVGLIAKQLEQQTGQPVRVINLSKTGALADDVLLRQLPELAGYNVIPDLITMEIGANDITVGYDESRFRANYAAILRQLPADKTVVSDLPYFGGRINVHGDDAKASDVIHELAMQHNISVAALHDTIKDHHSLRIYAADYFHPSNYAYTLWFDAFWTAARPLTKEPLTLEN